MTQRLHRGIKQHTGAGPAHHPTNHFTTLRLIAVLGTVLTWAFFVTKPATFQPTTGIIGQTAVGLAHLFLVQVMAAIKGYHTANKSLLASYLILTL